MNAPADIDCLPRWRRTALACLCVMLASGCTAFDVGPAPAPPALYSLDNALGAGATRPDKPRSPPTLLIGAVRAAAGFDSRHIIYLRQPHKLEYFARSEWVDTPGRMLSSLLVTALDDSGAFGAVLRTPGPGNGDLRLDTEIMQLQQEFLSQPSRVRFILRAQLLDDATGRVIATREFEAVAAAPSDDPYGGVVAANQAVAKVLEKLAAFCAQVAETWRLVPVTGKEPARPAAGPR